MDEKSEKKAVFLLLIGGFIGGVVLYLIKLPPVIVSLFLAIAVATTVFHFLGGISSENVATWGKIKLTGSTVVLIVVTLLLNKQLSVKSVDIQSMFDPDRQTWITLDGNGSPVEVKIKNVDPQGPLSIKPNRDLLKMNTLSLSKKGNVYRVVPESDKTFILGNLDESAFSNQGFFQFVESEKIMLYRTDPLAAGTPGAPLKEFLTARELPFKLTAGNYGNDLSGYHLIDSNGKDIHQGVLGVLQGEVVKIESNYYFIFVLDANHERNYARFAAYQIDFK
jgi:hypothetical protein